MIPIRHADPVLVENLTQLAEMCRDVGATASTVIYSQEKVVVFYKDPQTVGFMQYDSFDELHIQHEKNACILIAVFPADVL
jgi:hypothetical protein